MALHTLEPSRAMLHGRFSRELPPALTIDPGDTVRLRTLQAGWATGPRPSDRPGDRAPSFAPRDPERDDGHALCGPIAIRGAEPGMAPTLEWMRLTFRVELPLSVDTLEQHPFSDQTFLPQSDSPLIVFVCPSRPDGAPDAAGARAFHLPATMGVTFRRGVWHRSLAPLAAPSVFAMAMARTGRGDDSLVAKLDPPVEVVA